LPSPSRRSPFFLATCAVLAIGKLPFYRIDRTGAALLGASLMVAAGVLSAEEAYAAINFDTITLLLGMMIVVANLRVSGFFGLANHWVVRHVRRPLTLLCALVLVCGVLSAVLVNDTVCLVMTPLALDVVLRLRRDPTPYLLAIAMASNIGSVATITGNPQNMIVGSVSGRSPQCWCRSPSLASRCSLLFWRSPIARSSSPPTGSTTEAVRYAITARWWSKLSWLSP
jgi:Na+/H+ antiporter NhaD/arsenite permease-like protein